MCPVRSHPGQPRAPGALPDGAGPAGRPTPRAALGRRPETRTGPGWPQACVAGAVHVRARAAGHRRRGRVCVVRASRAPGLSAPARPQGPRRAARAPADARSWRLARRSPVDEPESPGERAHVAMQDLTPGSRRRPKKRKVVHRSILSLDRNRLKGAPNFSNTSLCDTITAVIHRSGRGIAMRSVSSQEVKEALGNILDQLPSPQQQVLVFARFLRHQVLEHSPSRPETVREAPSPTPRYPCISCQQPV
jgi:hypothetical protein